MRNDHTSLTMSLETFKGDTVKASLKLGSELLVLAERAFKSATWTKLKASVEKMG